MSAPDCPTCRVPPRLTNGAEIYSHRRDLHGKPFWRCDACKGYVGCHPGTTKALGTPADGPLRRARSLLHEERMDPIWKTAHMSPCYQHPMDEKRRKAIQGAARGRIYAWLQAKMGLTAEQCHTGMFTIEQCRQAWALLNGVTYMDIRRWAHENLGQGEKV